jgi:hypothetical protein
MRSDHIVPLAFHRCNGPPRLLGRDRSVFLAGRQVGCYYYMSIGVWVIGILIEPLVIKGSLRHFH